MLIEKFKQGKDVDFLKSVEKYVNKHFGLVDFNIRNHKI
jgi:hypothetical protein